MATNIGPVIGIDGEKEFRNQILNINAALKALASEEKAVTSAFDETDNSAEKLQKQNESLIKQIDEHKKRLELLQKGYESAKEKLGETDTKTLKWATTVNDATAEINKLERQLADNNSALENMGTRTQTATSAVDALANAIGAEKLLDGASKLADLLWECADASMSFESAMAGVAKTTDLTPEELDQMGKSLQQMSTEIPVAANELAGIAEAAGQLGIQKENLISFTRVMADLGVSTNLGTEEAASALAKFANITQMSADDYDKLGSTIVALGNNFATTEADIVSMATRLASAGSIIGLSEDQIVAVATALSSVGIEAEAGGSAISKLLKDFETMVATGDSSLSDFAKIAGLTADEFSKAWEKDAVRALGLFIDGLGALEKQGGNATATLSDLGLTEIRLSNAVLALAGSGGILTEALDLANTAWEENNALTNEAETRYATTESKMTMLKNAATNLEVAIGDQLRPALANLAETGSDVLQWATTFVEENPWVVDAITALSVALGVAAGALLAAKAAALAFSTALNTIKAHPVFAVISAIVSLSSAVAVLSLSTESASDATYDFIDSLEDSKKAYKDLAKETKNESENINNLVTSLTKAVEKEEKTATTKAAILQMVEQLNSALPDLGLSYDAVTDSLNMTTEALKQLALTSQEQKDNELTAQRLSELYVQQAESEQLLADAQERLNAAQQDYNEKVLEVGPLNQQNAKDFASVSAALSSARSEVEALTEAQNSLSNEISILEDQYNGLTEAQKNTDLGTEKFQQIQSQIQATADQMQTLATKYSEIYDAAYESLDGQTGLFKSFDNTVSTSAAELQENLNSQIKWMQDYTNNLQNLSERSVDNIDILVEALSDGSADSAAALAGLSSASDEEVSKIVESLQKVEDNKGMLADAIAQEVTQFDKKMSELEGSVSDALIEISAMDDDAKQAAINIVNGLTAGIDSKSGTLYRKMVALGERMIAGINTGTRSHSPSRAAKQSASYVIDGLILGIEDGQNEIDQLMEQVGERLISSFSSEANLEKAKSALEAYESYIIKYSETVKNTLAGIESEWDAAIQKQEQMAQKLSDYGDLLDEISIQWSDGTTTNYTQLSDIDQQIEKLNEYGTLLEQLTERGASESMMQEIVGLDIDEAIEYGQKLLSLTDEQFGEYVTKWEAKRELARQIAEQYYKDEIDALEKEYNTQLQAGLDGLKNTAFDSGVATVQGLIKGMQSKEAELQKQAAKIAAIVEQAMRTSLDIHSPSGVTEELGEYTADGFGIGFNRRMDEIDRMVRSDMPFQQQRDAQMVNAFRTVAAMPDRTPANITLVLPNGMELARWLIEDIRSLDISDPPIKNDF